MARADYQIVDVKDVFVAIIDLDLGNTSVTNDAEAVVAELLAQFPHHRIIYRDSDGRWDELVCDAEGRFSNFAPLPACFVWMGEED